MCGERPSRTAIHIIPPLEAVSGEMALPRPTIPAGHVEYFGIVFKCAVFMHHLPKKNLVNDAVHLPETTKNTLWLQGEAWELPNFENADTFINRLARNKMLAQDSVVNDVYAEK